MGAIDEIEAIEAIEVIPWALGQQIAFNRLSFPPLFPFPLFLLGSPWFSLVLLVSSNCLMCQANL